MTLPFSHQKRRRHCESLRGDVGPSCRRAHTRWNGAGERLDKSAPGFGLSCQRAQMCCTLSRAGGGARSAWPSDGAHSGAETGESCAAAIPTVIVTLMAPPPRRLCLHPTLPEAPHSLRGRCLAYQCCRRCRAAAARRRHLWAVRGIVGSYLHNIRVAERHEARWFSDVMPHDFGMFLVPHSAWPRAATAPAALDAALAAACF